MKTCKEKAAEWGIAERTVTYFCNNNRIPGAVKEGKSWKIPDDTERPADKRVKSGNNREPVAVTEKKTLPIGISDYIRAQSEYYYVDKTLLIREFLDKKPFRRWSLSSMTFRCRWGSSAAISVFFSA